MHLTKYLSLAALLATATVGLPSADQRQASPYDRNNRHVESEKRAVVVKHDARTINIVRSPTGIDVPPRLAELRNAALGVHNGTETRLDPRGEDVWGVYECSDQNFQGDCTWHQIYKSDGDGKCIHKTYPRVMSHNGSIGPDKGVECTVYEYDDCWDGGQQSVKEGLKFPGIADCPNDPWLDGWMELCPQSWKCKIL